MTGFENTLVMTGEDINYLHGPMVYIWWRGDICMYVGASSYGIRRVLSPNHIVLGKMWHEDTIEMLRFATRKAAFDTERQLIEKYNPRLNNKAPRGRPRKNSVLTSALDSRTVQPS